MVDLRRIGLYVAFSFGISWTVGLLIYLTGGLATALAGALVPTLYMFGPTMGNLLTRLVTREGWNGLYLRFHLKRAWPFWVLAYLGPLLMQAVGAMVFFVIFPSFFDPSMSAFQEVVSAIERQAGVLHPQSISERVVFAVLVGVIAVYPIFIIPSIFGEEFGWRAYLLPKLLPLGQRRAVIVTGLIWGVWHWPLIAMGFNYNFDYPGFPWLGMVLFVWWTVLVGTFLGWMVLRTESVWPAAIGHAMFDATSWLPYIFVKGDPSKLVGPFSAGIVGSLGIAAGGLFLLWWWPRKPMDEKELA